MKKRNTQFNPKRKIRSAAKNDAAVNANLVKRVGYGGNPEHKKNPGDFGLTPPSGPRPGKSLCDHAGIFSREVALKYVKLGLKKGLVSERFTDGWPQNIWAVTTNGIPLEAQLENPVSGTYHGYPMPVSDPLAEEVIKRWKAAQ